MSYRVRTVFSGVPGTPWLSTMYFEEVGGTAQQAATAVGTFWGAVDALMSSTVSWTTEADVSTINDATGELTDITVTTPVTGAGAQAVTLGPIVAQALVRWRTGAFINGRNLRGRTFVPGLIESQSDAGRPDASVQATINTAAAALIADANSVLNIWHRPNPPGSATGAGEAVLSGLCWNQWASLRSRRD